MYFSWIQPVYCVCMCLGIHWISSIRSGRISCIQFSKQPDIQLAGNLAKQFPVQFLSYCFPLRTVISSLATMQSVFLNLLLDFVCIFSIVIFVQFLIHLFSTSFYIRARYLRLLSQQMYQLNKCSPRNKLKLFCLSTGPFASARKPVRCPIFMFLFHFHEHCAMCNVQPSSFHIKLINWI